MDEEKVKEVLLTMTTEIYKTFRLLAEENKKLTKRIDELEKKFESIDQK
jgi:predicted nuclease with TOPRIM domain